MPVLIVSQPTSFCCIDEEVLNVSVREEAKGDTHIQLGVES